MSDRYVITKTVGIHGNTTSYQVRDGETGRVVVATTFSKSEAVRSELNGLQHSVDLLIKMIDKQENEIERIKRKREETGRG